LLEVELMLRGVIRERTRRRGFRLLANKLARRESLDLTLRDWVVSSGSLILTDRGPALSEPKAVGAQGSTKVLAASSLGSCLVFVSSAVVTVALAAIGRATGGSAAPALLAGLASGGSVGGLASGSDTKATCTSGPRARSSTVASC